MNNLTTTDSTLRLPTLPKKKKKAMTSPTRKRAAHDDDRAAKGKKSAKRQKPEQKKATALQQDDSGAEAENAEGENSKQDAHVQQQQEPETPFDKMDAQLISDYMARQIKRFEPDLSSVELEDRRVPG